MPTLSVKLSHPAVFISSAAHRHPSPPVQPHPRRPSQPPTQLQRHQPPSDHRGQIYTVDGSHSSTINNRHCRRRCPGSRVDCQIRCNGGANFGPWSTVFFQSLGHFDDLIGHPASPNNSLPSTIQWHGRANTSPAEGRPSLQAGRRQLAGTSPLRPPQLESHTKRRFQHLIG